MKFFKLVLEGDHIPLNLLEYSMSKQNKMDKHQQKQQPQYQKPGLNPNPSHNPNEKPKAPQHPSWEKKHK